MATRSSSGKSNGALDPALPQKKRARRRLVGAAAVCLAAAIVIPILLDSEPRQIRDDVQVRIPSRDTPLSERSDATVRSGVIAGATGKPNPGADSVSKPDRIEAPPDSPAADGRDQGSGAAPDSSARDRASSDPRVAGASAEAKAPATQQEKPAAKPAAKADPVPESKRDPIARLAEAKDLPVAKGEGYLVQIGAFSSEKGATEQVERARKVGFKAYTERLKTAQGDRIRVRIGPFASRDAADQARVKLRSAGVESVLVSP